MNSSIIGRVVKVVVFILLAAIVFFGFGGWATSVDTYDGCMETLQEIQGKAMGMTATATGLATVAAAVPGETTTPIANKLMDLAGYMVIVYVFITLEKYLLTLTGFLAFKILIPVGLLLCGGRFLLRNNWERVSNGFLQIAVKLIVLGLLLWALVPASLWTTDMIQNTYEEAYSNDAATLEMAEDVTETENTAEEVEEENESSFWGFLDNAKEKASELVDKAGGAVEEKLGEWEVEMNRMIEGVAVMIVTTCVIPICVLLLFLLIVRTVTGLNFSIPSVRHLPKMSKAVRGQTDKTPADMLEE